MTVKCCLFIPAGEELTFDYLEKDNDEELTFDYLDKDEGEEVGVDLSLGT
jgi:hypothetical protein